MDKNKNLNSDSSFEMEFKKSLRSFGFLFPTTDDEVAAFEKEFDINSVELPQSLQNPKNILKQGRIKTIPKRSARIINMQKTIDNMSIAARKGEEIPKVILDKMKKDRADTEKNNEE